MDDDEITPHDRHIGELVSAVDYFLFTEGKTKKELRGMFKTAIKVAELTERERIKIRAKRAVEGAA